MIISLVFGAIAGVMTTQIAPKLGDGLTQKTKLRLDAVKLQVLAFAVAVFVAGALAELASEAEAVWLVLGAFAGYFWQEIRDLATKR